MTEKVTSVRAIERALDILDCFKQENQELSLTEIARQIDLPLSTTSRIITTLEKRNYLSRAQDNKVYLGSGLVSLCNYCFAYLDFKRIAHPYMIQLRNIYSESVSLYVVQGEYRVCIERVETTHALRRVINVGDQFPLTRGAAGRLLLAYQPLEKIISLVNKDPFTNLEELEEIRNQQYTYSISEREEGVVSIAAPIFNGEKNVIAAIALSWPSVRFSLEQLDDRIPKIIEFAGKISKSIGY